MSKHWKIRSRGFSEKDKRYIFQLCVAALIFVLGVVIWFSWFFVCNCIFHWPIRWDVKACWTEQIRPAQEKAGEAASNFIP
jgi:hypothetical protein